MKRAVITGLGAVTPIGNNINDFWENLTNGVSGARTITKFDPTNYKVRFACEVKGFDPLQYMVMQVSSTAVTGLRVSAQTRSTLL